MNAELQGWDIWRKFFLVNSGQIKNKISLRVRDEVNLEVFKKVKSKIEQVSLPVREEILSQILDIH